MNQPVEKRGIIYVRVSSTEQVENTSLESQERNCREYADREGIDVVAVFIEEGESAKTANRTKFMQAISYCTDKKNKVTHFIVYKLDRFARNQNDHVITQTTLRRHGVALRSVTEPIDETPIGRVMEGVISVFAEFDNNVRTERSKGGMYEKIKKGIWQWEAPYGYYRPYKGSNLAKDPLVAPIVALMFEEYAKGAHTYQSLADFLNKRGYRTRKNKNFCAQTTERILKNSLYCAKIKAFGLEIQGDFDPIVSEELFEQCQKGYRKSYARVNRSKINPEFPLRKLCQCLECNKSLTGSNSVGNKGVKYPYYHHQKQGCSKAKSIPKDKFEEMFIVYLNKITPSKKHEKIFRAIMLDIWQENYKKFNENNSKIRKEVGDLEQERLKIFELHRSGIYTAEEFLEQKEFINTRIRQKQLLIQESHIEEFDMEEALNYCFRFVGETAKTWIRLKNKNFGHLLRFQKQIFLEKINFDGEKFETTDLALVYKLNQENGDDKSRLVTSRRIELRLTD